MLLKGKNSLYAVINRPSREICLVLQPPMKYRENFDVTYEYIFLRSSDINSRSQSFPTPKQLGIYILFKDKVLQNALMMLLPGLSF